MSEVTEIIENTVSEWGGNPRSINEGECDAFANEVLAELSTDGFELRTTEDLPEGAVITGKDKFRPEP